MLSQHGGRIGIWMSPLIVVDDSISAGSCVQHSFSGGESLTNDHEEGFFNIETLGGSVKVNWVDVGKELEVHSLGCASRSALAVKSKSLIHKLWSEERTTNTDCNDIFQWFSSLTNYGTISNLLGKFLNSIEDLMDILNDVFASNHQNIFLWFSKSGVEDISTFGVVDLIALHHRVNFAEKLCFVGDLLEMGETSLVDFGMSGIEDEFALAAFSSEGGVSLSVTQE